MALKTRSLGYTLIELMVTVGIIAILAGIAIPSYNSYISTTSGGVGLSNLDTLRNLQENYKFETNTYLAGSYVGGSAPNAFTQALHWTLNSKDKYSYTVVAGTTGDIATSLSITATCDNCKIPITVGN